MRRSRAGWLLSGIVVVALVAGACSSSDDDGGGSATDPGGEEPAGSTVGLTDTEIRISAIIPDTQPLVEVGLAPDFGDFTQNLGFFADEINADGGMGGRQVVMGYHLFPAGSTATDQQATCLGATEDDDAFAVVFTGGTFDETILCVTEQNRRLALTMAGAVPASVFERSEGRLFTNSVSVPRLMRLMVEAFDDQGELEGRTLGLVRVDQSRDEEIAEALRRALADRGYELAEEVALPCEGNACQQNDVAVQRLSGAGVDAVFTFLGPVAYPAFVGEAESQGWDPQWFASDVENQITATTARFFESAADAYDGALGITVGVLDAAPDDFRAGCNERFAAETGNEYEFGTDAWRALGNACEMMYRIDRVVDAIVDDGETLDQRSFISYMERERVDNGERQGDFGPDKHDAYDVLELQRFSGECVCWEVVPDSRILYQG